MFLTLITLLVLRVEVTLPSSSKVAPSSMEDLLFSLFDTSLSDTSSESADDKKDLKEYAKWLYKKEQEEYVDKMKKDISKEEKDQLKFFENVLQNVKKMGKNLENV